jgi:hypothetical protein
MRPRTSFAPPSTRATAPETSDLVLFPYSAAGPGLLASIEEFLRADPRDPGLARIVIEGRDVVQKALRART